jgi:hypothetical protein
LDAVLRGERVKGDSQVVKRCSFGRKPHTILRRVREWNRHNVAQLPAEVVQTARRRRHGQNGPILSGGGACYLLRRRRSWSSQEEGSSALADKDNMKKKKIVLKLYTKTDKALFFDAFVSAVHLRNWFMMKPLSDTSTGMESVILCHKMTKLLLEPRRKATKSGSSSFITNAVSA